MGLKKKNRTPPVLLLAVVEGGKDYSDLGEVLPGEETRILSILEQAMLLYYDSTRKDISGEGRENRRISGAIRVRARRLQKILSRKRRWYYESLLAGVGFRPESLTDTIREGKLRRQQAYGDHSRPEMQELQQQPADLDG